MPTHKTHEVLSVAPLPFDPQRCFNAMLDALRQHCVRLTGDEHRDISRVEGVMDQGEIFVLGYHGEIARLFFHLKLGEAPNAAEVSLRATKGNTDVLDADWGSTGPEIGNTIVVARLLHVVLCVLREQGIAALTNHPVDPRLRAHYATMGFDDVPDGGQHLMLSETRSLERAFRYIDAAYRRFGLNLRGPPP
jgi:hypothetical protein